MPTSIAEGDELTIDPSRAEARSNDYPIDASEELADALMRTSATILNPTIGSLSILGRSANMYGGQRAPFQYSPGWKMYFATTSPHHERACQLATRTETLPNGTLMTFGTPTTYPDILDQW